jgi:hypothetical protein
MRRMVAVSKPSTRKSANEAPGILRPVSSAFGVTSIRGNFLNTFKNEYAPKIRACQSFLEHVQNHRQYPACRPMIKHADIIVSALT